LADCAWYLERCPTIDTIDIGGGLGVRLTADHQPLTIAGNINEVIDLFAQDIWLPLPREGDMLALLNVGGYGSASSSNHCMRGQFTEYMLGMAPPE
jgi:diaminopimelate decarboxylase